ncbi:DUF2723 domain-containing protein, partial [bacterium]|nr:DUF2723 domain-containing protein [bacterium]
MPAPSPDARKPGDPAFPSGRRADALGFVLGAGPFLAWAWRHAAPGLTFHDSGEFALAADCWGVPHPPGAPTWVLLAGIFRHLGPWTDAARATNLFSGLLGAVTVGLAVVVVRRALAGGDDDRGPAPLLGGLAAGAILAGCRAFLDQAVVTEQYTLLTALGLAVVLAAGDLAAAAARGRPAARHPLLLGLLWGLACGNHLSQLVLGAVVVGAVLAAGRPTGRGRLVALVAAGFGLGSLVFVAMMLRARTNPALDWGHVADPGRLVWALARRGWETRSLGEVPDGFFAAWLRTLAPWRQLGPLALACAVAGMGLLVRERRRTWAWGGAAVVAYAVGIAVATGRQVGIGLDYIRHYGVADWHLPLYVAAAIAGGWGVGRLLGRGGPGRGSCPALAVGVLLVGALLAAGWSARREA